MNKTITSIIPLILLILAIPNWADAKIDLRISGYTYDIKSFDQDKVTYFSFSEVIEQFYGQLDWQIVGHTILYSEDTNKFVFNIESSYFKRNDSVFNMVYPAVLKDGQLFLPAETFIPLWDQVVLQKIGYNKDKKDLTINTEYFNITDITLTQKANGLLIELYLTSALPYDVFVTEGNWINISIRGGIVNRYRILAQKNNRYMYNLKAHQQDGSAQVSLRLKRNADKWHHKFQNDPPRIQISISDVNFEMEPEDTQPVTGLDKKIDVIVIDPGHGGAHYGAVGQNKTREKDVVLDISKELAKLIRKDKQFKVIMTRDRDKTVQLEERAKIANDNACDLFISIHANSSTKKHVTGWNVFFLAEAKNDSARSVAQFENSAFLRDMTEEYDDTEITRADVDPISMILNEMIMTEFQAESYDFALMVDKEFRRNLRNKARGVDQAGFFVLNKVFAPSVLVETGFISNKSEEKLLKDRNYQKDVAKAIYEAIKRFKLKYEG